MKPLTIEINGTGTHNRGAELMAIAVCQRINSSFPDARIVVSSCFGTPQEIAKYGFLRTSEYRGLVIGKAKSLALKATRGFRGELVDPAEVDVILDASGFAFSDQWGENRAVRETQALLHDQRSHQTLIMLPQALGPFQNPGVAEECKRLFERAALICARDTQSFASVKDLGFSSKLRQYPDFTVDVSAIAPSSSTPKNYVAIVPNFRMLDKGGDHELYLAFLRQAIAAAKRHGRVPTFVLHDANKDRKVIAQLGSNFHDIPILTDADPRILKGMLGRAEFVIGSRFHALVSALSQGIPCIGAGWSHKYPELFKDFACPELLIPNLDDLSTLDSTVQMLCDLHARSSLRERICQAAAELKRQTELMWQETEAIIRSTLDPTSQRRGSM